MNTRNKYLQTLINEGGYHLLLKKKKTELLNEYCKNTKQNRKYVIRKIRNGKYLSSGKRKRRSTYDNRVKVVLIRLWEIFDHPCGQRLKPLLETEVDRLRKTKELMCSDSVAEKLKKISFRTIDEKLSAHKEKERFKQQKKEKVHPLLYQKIPIKIFSEQNREELGNAQIDYVEHCGTSAKGEYLNTLSTTDILCGWWEGEAVKGKGQTRTKEAIDIAKSRYPFPWKEIHSDNGVPFINAHLYGYTIEEGLCFSRSRPYEKNDNCLVEQKNWTHVRKKVGYLRYDTQEEQDILNDLYRNEMRLFKNFFQPVMKLVNKERIGSKVKRRYDKPKTPYHRVMELKDVPDEVKKQLTELYESLNPAKLKRNIDKKLRLLWRVHQMKQEMKIPVVPHKKSKPRSVTSYTAQPKAVRLPSYVA